MIIILLASCAIGCQTKYNSANSYIGAWTSPKYETIELFANNNARIVHVNPARKAIYTDFQWRMQTNGAAIFIFNGDVDGDLPSDHVKIKLNRKTGLLVVYLPNETRYYERKAATEFSEKMKPFYGEWKLTNTDHKFSFTLNVNGTAIDSEGNKGEWADRTGNQITIYWKNSNVDSYAIKPNSLIGINSKLIYKKE